MCVETVNSPKKRRIIFNENFTEQILSFRRVGKLVSAIIYLLTRLIIIIIYVYELYLNLQVQCYLT